MPRSCDDAINQPAPRLSFCIPTHQGRGWSLREALDSIRAQIDAGGYRGRIEFCISDNGSSDETQQMVADYQKLLPDTVAYHHFPLDVGPYNFLNSVRMARGEYCWFLGSDDVLEEGAIANVLALLDKFPGCSGITAAYDQYSFDMRAREPNHPDAYFPAPIQDERVFGSARAALPQCCLALSFMSVQLFRRELWESVVGAESREMVFYSQHHLHVYLLSRLIAEDPHWVWSPRVIIRMRGNNGSSISMTQERSYGHPLMFLSDMTSIWTRICGADRATYAAMLRKAYRVTWSPQVVRHIKLLPRHRAGDDLGMLAQFTRYLWVVPDFWLGSFWALLVPAWFWQGLARSGLLGAAKRLAFRRS